MRKVSYVEKDNIDWSDTQGESFWHWWLKPKKCVEVVNISGFMIRPDNVRIKIVESISSLSPPVFAQN